MRNFFIWELHRNHFALMWKGHPPTVCTHTNTSSVMICGTLSDHDTAYSNAKCHTKHNIMRNVRVSRVAKDVLLVQRNQVVSP
jgi:hypothetical protein